MKSLSIFIISCFTAVCAIAQSNIIVTVTLNGNMNREVLIDGTPYYPTDYSNTSTNNKSMITVNNLAAGQHTLQVVRTNSNRRNVGNERVFNLRRGYDLDIIVNGNGTVQLTEKRIRGNRPANPNTGTAMNNYNFSILVRDINSIGTNAGRVSALNTAFTSAGNYFTTTQVSQLVRLTTGDANRIALLKTAYPTVTDPGSFSTLYSLISSTAGRNEVANYVSVYGNGNTGTYPVAMAAADFNQLLNSVRSKTSNDIRVNVVFGIFSTATNNFTSNQARRLIQTVTGEANMIHLAKAAYRSVVDKQNFQTVYNLIPTQAGRNDVVYYVRNYDPNVVYNGTVVTANTAMSETEFNTLISGIRKQWIPGAKKASVINAFNAGDFFTVAQASQLIQLDQDEDDRLDMAKASYKTLVDPSSFSHIINLFSSSAYRTELTAYAQNYSYSGSIPGTGYRTAMNEAEFISLVSSIRGHWLPGAKKAAVLNAFNNSGNYFTAAQASQLVQLDNDEPDRLDMAKAAYKVLVDPENFAVVYNLFSSQAYKDELSVYVNANRY